MAGAFLVAGGLRDLDKHFKFCFLAYLFCYNHSDCRTCEHKTSLMSLETGKRKDIVLIPTLLPLHGQARQKKIKMDEQNYHHLVY